MSSFAVEFRYIGEEDIEEDAKFALGIEYNGSSAGIVAYEDSRSGKWTIRQFTNNLEPFWSHINKLGAHDVVRGKLFRSRS